MIDVNAIFLNKGWHDRAREGHSLMEVVSMFAGEEFSAEPACVSPVLRQFGGGLNDTLDESRRQKLTRFIPRLPGTADDGLDEARGFLALDWLVRVYAPAWLRLVPELTEDADRLARCAPIVDAESAAAVNGVVRAARVTAHGVAGDTFWAATGDAARDAAATTGDAAWAVASGEAGGSARSAAVDAADVVALNGVLAAAWCDSVNDAGRAAAAVSWGTAVDAARNALAPTVAGLQESAIDLFDRMITGEITVA